MRKKNCFFCPTPPPTSARGIASPPKRSGSMRPGPGPRPRSMRVRFETHDNLDCHYQPNLVDIAWYCHNSGGVPHPANLRRPMRLGSMTSWGTCPSGPTAAITRSEQVMDCLRRSSIPWEIFRPASNREWPVAGSGTDSSECGRAASTMDTAAWGVGPGVRLVRTLKPGEDWKVKL